MKKFNVLEAKAGKPFHTREGLPVRIICWDRKTDNNMPIIGLVKENDKEIVRNYTILGECNNSRYDLYMDTIEHIAYTNIIETIPIPGLTTAIKTTKGLFESKEEAFKEALYPKDKFIAIGKVTWEE